MKKLSILLSVMLILTCIFSITVNASESKKNVLVTSVKVDKAPSNWMFIDLKENIKINTVVNPRNATNKKLTYSVSDKATASVSKDGVLTGKKAGICSVYIKTNDKSNKTLTLRVRVLSVKERLCNGLWSIETNYKKSLKFLPNNNFDIIDMSSGSQEEEAKYKIDTKKSEITIFNSTYGNKNIVYKYKIANNKLYLTNKNKTIAYTNEKSVDLKYVTKSGFTYKTVKDKIILTGYIGGETNVTIPKTVNNKPVIELNETFTNNSKIKSIKIPNGLNVSIGYNAFWGCTNLENISLGDKTNKISEGAFAYCTSLTNITIPSSVKSLGYGAFQYCTSLNSITLKNGLEKIETLAFLMCIELKEIYIPKSVTYIGIDAFEKCDNLKDIIR